MTSSCSTLCTPTVLKLADRIGWDLVISLKQNQRELYQSAVRLFASRPADGSSTERHDGKQYQFQFWDSEGFLFTADHPQPEGVVRSEEKLTQNHYRRGKLQSETTEHEWLWITTLDSQTFPATFVRRLGHDRRKLENNGWNDLTQNWPSNMAFYTPAGTALKPPPSRVNAARPSPKGWRMETTSKLPPHRVSPR